MRNYIITASSLTIVIGNKPYIIDKSHANFEKIKEAIKTVASDEYIISLIDVSAHINEYTKGKIIVKDGVVRYKGIDVRNALTTRILTMVKEGFNIDGICIFMENLYNNPSKTAVDELYLFLEACNLPITEDGHFLAYKKVKSNYKDIHSGTFDNSVGQKPWMDRNMVDDNRNNTCSQGLHFASYSYMSSFGNSTTDRIMILKINPADVVSIPSDYDNAKGRCWQYEVIGEVPNDGKTQIKNDCIKDNTCKPVDGKSKKGSHPFKRVKESISKALYSQSIDVDTIIGMVVRTYGFLTPLEYKNFNELATFIRDKAYELRFKYSDIDMEIVNFVEGNSVSPIVGLTDEKVEIKEDKKTDLNTIVLDEKSKEVAKDICSSLYSGIYKVSDILGELKNVNVTIGTEFESYTKEGLNYNKLSKILAKLCYNTVNLTNIHTKLIVQSNTITESELSGLPSSIRIDYIKNKLIENYVRKFGSSNKQLLLKVANCDIRLSIEKNRPLFNDTDTGVKMYNNTDIPSKLNEIETKLKRVDIGLWDSVVKKLDEGDSLRKQNDYKGVVKVLRKLAEESKIDLGEWLK